ncbi:hypothetical protein I8752_29600 [Nostocaceae cyanobacterium CENA369]|uniref:Uncharacterized protein n=1 Tax=Dendronalium phyllosphericum CENA369 TaxID=1725256 RepID=A0A8J7I7Q8_9NOST|nr:hypothetical protein [Dendronalium phyllosphericum]MBH8577064.1 hypothetical protein [Dendronalium phyllosphericum CENA369]
MNDQARLNDIKEILEILYEKLGYFQKELTIASQSANFELKQRIKREILPDIRKYETEYWELYPKEAIIISDEEAESQLVEVEQAVDSIEKTSSNNDSSELIPLLHTIRDKLDKQDKTASAKLKLVLPLIPAIASYELEMETEGLISKVLKTVRSKLPR